MGFVTCKSMFSNRGLMNWSVYLENETGTEWKPRCHSFPMGLEHNIHLWISCILDTCMHKKLLKRKMIRFVQLQLKKLHADDRCLF